MKKLVALSIVAMMVTSVMAFHPDTECSRCHIPHMAADNSGVPLWNGAQTITYEQFTAYYEGFKMEAAVGTAPQGSTLLCLSCHDGGTSHAMAPAQGDMSGTHPIEFIYDASLATADGELMNPLTTDSGIVGSQKSIHEDLLTPDGTVNCVSCHDIHLQGLHGTIIQAGTTDENGNAITVDLEFDFPHLVNMPGIQWSYNSRSNLPTTDPNAYRLEYSTLCRTCHIK
jgi:hypothetical protein